MRFLRYYLEEICPSIDMSRKVWRRKRNLTFNHVMTTLKEREACLRLNVETSPTMRKVNSSDMVAGKEWKEDVFEEERHEGPVPTLRPESHWARQCWKLHPELRKRKGERANSVKDEGSSSQHILMVRVVMREVSPRRGNRNSSRELIEGLSQKAAVAWWFQTEVGRVLDLSQIAMLFFGVGALQEFGPRIC
jgi:hypothetical protein